MGRRAAAPASIRVVIAEDHLVVADGLVTMLGFESDIAVVDVVTTSDALIASVLELGPEIALVDISLESSDGLVAVRTLAAGGVSTRMIALTMHTDRQIVTRAVEAGVSGYLPKNVRRQELVAAIRAVAAGRGVLHPDVTRPLLERAGGPRARPASNPLTSRERQVLEQLATGKTTHEIAVTLGLGAETVKSHLSHIYTKLDAGDRVQAVAIALRTGLMR